MKKNDKPFLHTKICRSVLFSYVGHIKLCRSVFYNWFSLAEFSQQVTLPTTTAAAAKIHSVSDCCQGVNFHYKNKSVFNSFSIRYTNLRTQFQAAGKKHIGDPLPYSMVNKALFFALTLLLVTALRSESESFVNSGMKSKGGKEGKKRFFEEKKSARVSNRSLYFLSWLFTVRRSESEGRPCISFGIFGNGWFNEWNWRYVSKLFHYA